MVSERNNQIPLHLNNKDIKGHTRISNEKNLEETKL